MGRILRSRFLWRCRPSVQYDSETESMTPEIIFIYGSRYLGEVYFDLKFDEGLKKFVVNEGRMR